MQRNSPIKFWFLPYSSVSRLRVLLPRLSTSNTQPTLPCFHPYMAAHERSQLAPGRPDSNYFGCLWVVTSRSQPFYLHPSTSTSFSIFPSSSVYLVGRLKDQNFHADTIVAATPGHSCETAPFLTQPVCDHHSRSELNVEWLHRAPHADRYSRVRESKLTRILSIEAERC
ncbi:hypothetical protein GALMADRAFT_718329 [Galerina marginata CBS 339.88]|uniref:Uncharacterized protein n=1 Tax=Galerina marginata (strain CBS 339.88) TaxID=685588 RepID=A0A067TX99_GALM3|nr:hypothetical protein GALMADRAFT_718329 [Galerina marginata CBS 339.88]